MKILIVEDIAEDRYLLKLNLEHRGCQVIEASNGKEGLRLANIEKPDVIISDALMPIMDGFQFLRSIKTNAELHSIPFVYYSAVYTGYKESELALSLGAVAFIRKPKDPQEFWEELVIALEECKRNKETVASRELFDEEEEFLRKYSQIVVKKLEQKVRELEAANATIDDKVQEWQETFDSISDCVTIHDTEFNVLLSNKACSMMLDASPDKIRSKKCFELFHRHGEPVEGCPMFTAVRTGHSSEAERFEPSLNRWLSISCFPLFKKDGAVRGVVHYAKDITRRKSLEKDLALSEARFRATFEQAAVGIAHVATDGRWLKVNQKLCDIVGYTRDELLSKTFQDITHPDDLETDLNFLRQMLADEIKTYTMEKRYFHKGGLIVWISLTVSLVRNDLGKPDYFISVVENISERKNLEEQLLQSQKMEAVGTMAGGIAHDFNNILMAITGFGGLALMKMADDDPQKKYVEQVLEAATRASHLTNDLLLFSRKQVSERKAVDLNASIRKIEKFLSRVIGEDVECRTVLQELPIVIQADEHQIGQVLMNLATNARDSMPGGGVLTVTAEKVVLDKEFVSAHGYGKPGEYALLTASDTGKGMDKETRQHIFDPFFTTKDTGKGTGLGLAVVYGIIKQHEGYINVYSEPGLGSTFRVYLPLAAAETAEESVVLPQEPPDRGTETILLAEDNDMVRAMVKDVLEEFGYTVVEAIDGEDAVRQFMTGRESIKLLLFDLIMPKKNGKEAFDEISKLQPGIKIIFISGYAPESLFQKAVPGKDVHQINKPISPSQLLRKIRSVLDEKARNTDNTAI